MTRRPIEFPAFIHAECMTEHAVTDPCPATGAPIRSATPQRCMTDCACRGTLMSDDCKLLPGCDSCAHWEVVPGHVVAQHVSGVVLVHLHYPSESLHAVVRREVDEEAQPRWMN